jgi:predicted phage terminase large subunit-like protein
MIVSGEGGLIAWALTFLPHHFPSDPAPFHYEIAEFAEEFDRVAIAAPRGHAKSTLLDLAFALFRAACKDERYILIISDTHEQAASHVGNIFEELLENELLVETYPHLRLPEMKDYKRQRAKKTAHDFITLGGIRFTAFGVGKSLRGLKKRNQRPTLIIGDDLENDASVTNEKQRKKLSDWVLKSLSNLFGAEGGKLIVIGTILHGLALLPALMANPAYKSKLYRALEAPEGWTLQSIFENPKPLWAGHWTAAKLKAKHIEVGSAAFSSEFMNKPVPPDARLFKREWFKLTRTPAPSNAPRVRAWDFAGTEDGGDWTAGPKISRDQNRFVIEGIERFQGSPNTVRMRLKATAERDGRHTHIRIPQDPGQAGKDQVLNNKQALAGYIVHSAPVTGDKRTRATPLAVQAEAGWIEILERVRPDGTPDDEANAWIPILLNELDEFPVGKHDDQVDALADGFNLVTTMKPSGFFAGLEDFKGQGRRI